jgi:hypothetical protein
MKTRVKKQVDTSHLESLSFADDIPLVTQDLDETTYKPQAQAVRLPNQKITSIEKKKIRIKTFAETIKALPVPGERLFIIGGGNIDAIHSIHVTLDFLSCIDEMYIATWSMTGDNIKDLFLMFDRKKIKKLNILIAHTFRRIRKVEYPMLVDGMRNRGQRMVVCQNHSKIILMKAPGHHLTVDGSANFTVNPRIEQVNFTNSEKLYNFNRDWMDSVLAKIYPEMKKRRII